MMKPDHRSEGANDDAIVSKFIADMMPTKLFYSKPTGYLVKLWVFWTQEVSRSQKHTSVQDRILTALCNYGSKSNESFESDESDKDDVLIQFWAPETIEGRSQLTTNLQPFALQNIRNEKFIQYWKHCLGDKHAVADVKGEEKENLMAGIVGRVFRNKLPELCLDLSNYSVTEYPNRDFALRCGIISTAALPVLVPTGIDEQCCVGVLELIFPTSNCALLGYNMNKARLALKGTNLETVDTEQIRYQQIWIQDSESSEIKAALKQVCDTHDLPLAVGWHIINRVDDYGISHQSYNHFPTRCKTELLVSIPEMSFSSNDNDLNSYRYASRYIPLRVNKGLVGLTLFSHKAYLCRDVRQLDIIEYPLVHCARGSGLAGSFALCLRTFKSTKHEYAIEFFLTRNVAYDGDFGILFSSILATLKEHLKTFEVVTGDIRSGLFIEVDGNLEAVTVDMENDLVSEVYRLTESFAEASIGEDKNVVYGEQSNATFTYEMRTTETEYSLQSFPTTESTSKTLSTKTEYSLQSFPTTESTSKTISTKTEYSLQSFPTTSSGTCGSGPSPKRSKLMTELDQVMSRFLSSAKKSENSGWGNIEISSWNYPEQLGFVTASRPMPIPNMNKRSRDSSILPRSDGSHWLLAWPPVSNTELVTIKVHYEEDIVKFILPASSSKADLVEKIVMRLPVLEDKDFVINYLHRDSYVLLATDEDLQVCVDRSRSRFDNLIRMFIQLKADEQSMSRLLFFQF